MYFERKEMSNDAKASFHTLQELVTQRNALKQKVESENKEYDRLFDDTYQELKHKAVTLIDQLREIGIEAIRFFPIKIPETNKSVEFIVNQNTKMESFGANFFDAGGNCTSVGEECIAATKSPKALDLMKEVLEHWESLQDCVLTEAQKLLTEEIEKLSQKEAECSDLLSRYQSSEDKELGCAGIEITGNVGYEPQTLTVPFERSIPFLGVEDNGIPKLDREALLRMVKEGKSTRNYFDEPDACSFAFLLKMPLIDAYLASDPIYLEADAKERSNMRKDVLEHLMEKGITNMTNRSFGIKVFLMQLEENLVEHPVVWLQSHRPDQVSELVVALENKDGQETIDRSRLSPLMMKEVHTCLEEYREREDLKDDIFD